MPDPATLGEGRLWLVTASGRTLATFQSREAACHAARTIARLDLLSGRVADAWLAGCSPTHERIPLEVEAEPQAATVALSPQLVRS